MMRRRHPAACTLGLLTAALALLSGSAGPARAGLVLQHGDFQTGALAPWFQDRNFGGSENWNVTSAVAHSGTFSATDVGNLELRQNFTPTPVSSITQVSFWAEHPNPSASALAYDFFYSDGSDVENVVFTTGTGWNFFDVTSHLTAGKTLTGFSVFGNSGGRTYLDDVTIATAATAVPEPSTLAPAATAAVMALACAYRKRGRRP
jgi:hypothetical protein